ncbi:hypothetical protein Cgig2_026419 [Carnegiea gigantea]|uniref:Uncharacterized protein n=1 Tax=Carnegiea gigantea TaxID=171969 RepID=A0A9Q1JKY5_9CARY|nr:hypothetical protein Cgig2_026419 [Carnegiea gigantea]
MADFVRESFRWHWRSAVRQPCPLPDDYWDLCPHFTLSDAKRAVHDFELPEMVQATFYAMLLNDVVELGKVSSLLAVDLKLILESLSERESTEVIEGEGERMTTFPNFLNTKQATEYVRDNFHWSLRESSTLRSNLLPENFYGLCPNFELLMAMRFAHISHIPEMIQAIFYDMVLNEVEELGLSSRSAIDHMISDLQELK